MKKEKGLLMVILVGFLIGGTGLLALPQSGLAQTPYSIRKAKPAKGLVGKTVTFKAGKPKMVGSPQGKIIEKPALKVQKLIPAAEKKSKLVIKSLIEPEKPKLELQAEPIGKELTKPKLRIEKLIPASPVQYKLEVEAGSLEPAKKNLTNKQRKRPLPTEKEIDVPFLKKR